MNDLSTIEKFTLIILAVMVGQYAGVVWLAALRLRAGHNGATYAIMVNGVALALMAGAVLLYILFPLPEGVVMLSLFAVAWTNFYLIGALRVEAARPLKKLTATRKKVFKDIDDK